MGLTGKVVVVIGGSSGIGLAAARQAAEAGAEIVIGGRDETRLAFAAATIGSDSAVRRFAVDTGDMAALDAFFGNVGRFDHLLVTAATYVVVPITDPDDDAAQSPFHSKFWGQYRAIRAALPFLSSDGSITLMAGAAGARPVKGGAAYAACNAAIEGLGRGLAMELAPIRVNTVSPGTIDGALWRRRDPAVREDVFRAWRDQTLLERPGREEEVAHAILFLMTNRFTTGSTIYPDGGYSLR